MTKQQFIKSVSDLWNEFRRLAGHADQIVYMELEKHGDMDKEFLYGDNEDFDKVWLDDNKWLTYIKRDSNYNINIGTEYDCGEEEYYLSDMSPDDSIEIASFLCRR